MSEEMRRKSHAITWIVTLVCAPVVYLLLVPPLLTLPPWGKHGDVPLWVALFSEPYGWVAERTPLGGPLDDYFDWWFERANPPPQMPRGPEE